MLNNFPSREIVEALREEFPAGTRVELIRMEDAQAPPVGTLGTVRGVDDIGSIMVSWDNGCGLNVAYGEDICRKVEDKQYITHEGHTFEVVEEVPLGYSIWNIGERAPKGYLPLCQTLDGAWKINAETLKAIKTDDAQAILKISIRGYNTLPSLEKYLSHCENRRETVAKVDIELCRKALTALRSIKGAEYLKK